jgi:hypothetical protein
MKLLLSLACGLIFATGLPAQTTKGTPVLKPLNFRTDPAAMEFAKEAGTQAIRQWLTEFVGKGLGPKTFAIVPFQGDIDEGYFTDAASSEFANVGLGSDYRLYTSMNDPVLETINREMMTELDAADKDDIFDAASIQRYRRVNVEGLIVGRIAGIYYAETPPSSGVQVEGFGQKAVQVRVMLRAYENSTGRILWGAERVASVSLPATNLVVQRNWLLYAAGGLALIILLFIAHRMLLAGNRPR